MKRGIAYLLRNANDMFHALFGRLVYLLFGLGNWLAEIWLEKNGVTFVLFSLLFCFCLIASIAGIICTAVLVLKWIIWQLISTFSILWYVLIGRSCSLSTRSSGTAFGF